MKNLKQFFSFLNDVSFPYVVLRNWEHLPYSVELGQHSDLDLLVYDLDHFLEIIPGLEREFASPRVRFKLFLEDEQDVIYMDVRHVGDGYYPTAFQKNLLATRERHERGFWTPNNIHFYIALAYHAVHHKGAIAPEYRRWLGDATLKQLLEALHDSVIGWVKPIDPTVGSFNAYWKGATSTIEKGEDGIILKRQVAFLDYDLIKNESDILVKLEGDHFPGHAGLLIDGTLRITDCGSPLTVDNLPENWVEQLAEILLHLKRAKVRHRDIRPDNLMVKDGVIKLIDFGWSVSEDSDPGNPIVSNPPSVLGFPFKSSQGFDDAYSMTMVKKHFDFLLEERELKLANSGN